MAEKKRILVVDDEPDMVDMLKTALETASFDVITGSDGEQAVTKARAERPDAVILDLMMPGKNGFDACKELKNDPATASIPVLVLTAIGQHLTDTKYAKDMGLQLESEDFIKKPVDPAVLVDRLRSLLG